MKFIPLDRTTWARESHFTHFLHALPCSFSMTQMVDISPLLICQKQGSYTLYPALLHCISFVVNQHSECRLALNEHNILGYWQRLHPSYTVFHQESETFSTLWTPFDENFSQFHAAVRHDIALYADQHCILPKQPMPEQLVPISNIPWSPFTAFNLNIATNTPYLFPIFTCGKISLHQGKSLLPLAIQVHHAACDAFHVTRLFDEIQKRASNASAWLY